MQLHGHGAGHTSINANVAHACNAMFFVKIKHTISSTLRESSIMGHLSIETRTRVIHLCRKEIPVQHIVKRLAEEDNSISLSALYELLEEV